MNEEEIKEMIKSLDNIFNYCEEIDNNLPEEDKTGYKMFNDYIFIKHGLLTVLEIIKGDVAKEMIEKAENE